MTKVTMITRGSPDMLADIVADGMIRLLGRENVHLVTSLTGHEDPMKSHFFKRYAEPNSIGFSETDALVTTTRSGTSDIMRWWNETGSRAIAVLDGEDDTIIRTDFLSLVRKYFKREYYYGSSYDSNVAPLPFGAIPEEVQVPDSKDGFFVKWRGNDPIRDEISSRCNALGLKDPPGTFVTKDEYNRRLVKSAIGISAKGVGWDTYRFWEIPYFGTTLLSQRLAIVIPDNFKDGEEAVFFDNADDCIGKLNDLLAHPDRTRDIARAGFQKVHEKHLSIHRARTVLGGIL